MIYNYTCDLCGLILNLLVSIVYIFNRTEDNKQKYLFKLMSLNFLLCTFSIITALFHNNGYSGIVLLVANYLYCFVCIHILNYVVLYIYRLIPENINKTDKMEKKVKLKFLFSEIILVLIILVCYMLKIDINKIISYCKYWSYINIGFTILICSLILYCFDKNKIPNLIKKSTLIIFPFLLFGGIFQFTHTNIKISGFLYSLLVIFFFTFYHSKQMDVITGGYLNETFAQDFNHFIKKKKDFYVITILLSNYDFLKRTLGEEVIDEQLANVFKTFSSSNLKLKIYRESIDKVSFLIENKDTKNIKLGIKNMESLFFKQNLFFKEISESLHFKIFYAKCPKIINDFRDYLKIRKNIYDKCEVNNLYEIKEDDVTQLLLQENLLTIFEDIFTKNNPYDERIQVVYQPILDLDTNKFKTMEALTRLYIDGKTIYPDNFIPLLENNRLIHKYSLLVLEKICIFLNKIKNENFDLDGISVNFSSDEFAMLSFKEDIINILNKYDVDPSYIRLELTESNDVATQDIIANQMKEMQELGFKFYLDDFGTGYSNITKLALLKFDTIKIDKSIVWNSISNSDIKKLLIDLTTFIRAMDMDVLFEGIENEDMATLTNNVKYLQGYLYSKPIPEDSIIEFLKEKEI